MNSRHGHASLRFDADPEQLAEFLVRLVLSHNLALLTTTESRSPRLVRAVRRHLPKEYGVVRRFEYLIIWHRPTYRSHWLAFLAVLDPRSFPMLGGRRMFRIARKRFTHRPTGTRLRAEVGHAPSGVSAGPGKWNTAENPDRVRISQAGFVRWGRRLDRYAHNHPDAAAVLHMDSNLNQLRPRWMTYLEQTLHAPSIWRAGLHHRGSHGLSLIDTAHVLHLAVEQWSATVLDLHRPPKLDHDPIVYTVTYEETER